MSGCGCSIEASQLTKKCREKIVSSPKISKKDFISGDLYAKSLFVYYLAPDKLIKALNDIGIYFNADNYEKELLGLSLANKKGLDLNGTMKDENGKPIIFDFSKIIGATEIKKEDIKNNPITFY